MNSPQPWQTAKHLTAPKWRHLASALLLVSATAWAGTSDSVARPHRIALKAAHLFDAVSGQLLEPAIVVIKDDRIEQVGSHLTIPADAQQIDLGDATLVPGFIDAHVHLTSVMSDNWYKDFFDNNMKFPAEQALFAAPYAKATLEAGVTTVRDLGSNNYVALGLRNAIRADRIVGPRMLVANYGIGATGGHADDDPFPPERVAVAGPIQGVCNGPDACRAAVRYQIKYGADVIKFMPSGGVLSLSDPIDNPQLTQEEMNAIVSEAHAWGRKVAAHCHGDRAAKMALIAGVDSIEHGTFLQEDTMAEMKRKHVFLVPTRFAAVWVGEKADGFPPAIATKSRDAAAHHAQMFAKAAAMGVPIAMGTDAGVNPHGKNAREFSLMVEGGMTPAQALMAGTANGAELLGIQNDTGTLEAGKYADIVAVPGNVLKDIHATEHPVLVMKEGRIYLRTQ